MTSSGDPPAPGRTRTLNLRAGAASTPPPLGPGARVAGFVVDEARFEGGFAVVYRAHEAATGVPVALKVLRPHLAASRTMAERFAREATMLAQLSHPQIVRYLGAGVLDSGQPFIAMEWLEGHDLAVELKRRGPLALAEAVAVLSDLCDALGAAHALGLVHRDLKPQNVMVLPRGDWFAIKLVDFGIAKQLDLGGGDVGSTSSSVLLGTPANMAPEQILGLAVDARTDVYALGLLAFQLVCGKPAYSGQTFVEIEELHLSAPPPRASDLAPVPPAFDALVARCLRKSPAERFASAADFMAAARALVAPPAGARARLLVEARVAGSLDDIDDAAFDDIEASLELARAAFAAAGATIVVESSTSVVASMASAGEARALAARLEDELGRREGKSQLVQMKVGVED